MPNFFDEYYYIETIQFIGSFLGLLFFLFVIYLFSVKNLYKFLIKYFPDLKPLPLMKSREKYSSNLLFIAIPSILAVVCLYYAVVPLTNLISPQFTTVVGTKINEYSAGTGRDYTDNWYIKIADRTIEVDNGVQNFSTWIEKVNIGDKCKITYSARTKYLLSAEDLSKKQ